MTARSAAPTLIILITVLLATAIGLGSSLWQQNRLASSASDFSLQLLQEVLGNGQASSLVERAHPQFLSDMPAGSLHSYVANIRNRLGPLERLSSIRGGIDRSLLSFAASGSTAAYSVEMQFANDEAAEAWIELAHNGQDWQVSAFRVESQLLYD
jgi:hypothetical protein